MGFFRYDVVVGLGSNIGAKEAHLKGATKAIENLQKTLVVAVSSLRETIPIGGPPQDNYLNGAIRLSCELSLVVLLEELLRIELDFARTRQQRWGPRTLDLDILWVDGVCVSLPNLTIPHPRLAERVFALEPLVEIAPLACDPSSGKLWRDQLEQLKKAKSLGCKF